MALTVQNLRAVGTGVEPASLLPGQIAFNVTDKVLFVGDGSGVKTSFDGTQVPGVAGNGWYSMPMDFDSLGAYYVANPSYYGDTPTDQQVLTWSTALNHPIWTNGGGSGGGNQVYIVTNADVAAAPGSTTSSKITAAIGVASPDEGDVTIVTGLPDDVYEGLYFFAPTEWVRGASYAYPSASEVIYNNVAHPTLTPTVQGAIDDLDDGLAATTAIANTANSTANSALSIANAALPKAGGTMTGTIVSRAINVQPGYDIQLQGSDGILFNSGANGTILGISDLVTINSSTTAASSAAVRTAYNLAQAAVPRSTYTAAGDLVVGTGASAFVALPVGTPGQILAVDSSGNGIEWVTDSQGDVTSVTGTSPIVIDNTDAQNPIVTINAASTTQPGAVQLNDTLASTSTTEALTANQGYQLQSQIDNLTLASNVTLGGSFDCVLDEVDSVTAAGGTAGLAVGSDLPAPVAAYNDIYVIVTVAGSYSPPGGGGPYNAQTGDWFLCGETASGSGIYVWQYLGVGARPAYATPTSAGIIQIATPGDTQSGGSATLAVTPAGLQSKVSDSTSTTSSTTIASSTAVKSAYDLANTANTTANAALPKAGGIMTGDITLSGAGVGVVFNDASTIEAISDSVATTSSVTAASSAAVKNAYDLGNAALARSGGTMTGAITFAAGQIFPVSGIQDATTGQKGIVQIGTNINVSSGTISVPAATTAAQGAVQVGTNIDVSSGTISVKSSTTTQSGVVQLNDTLASTSTTEALTANMGRDLQVQINALATSNNLTFAGTIDGATGDMITVTTEGAAVGFVVNDPLPAPTAAINEYFVIVTTAGTMTPPGGVPTLVYVGDWWLASSTTWTYIAAGFQPPYASTTTPGLVRLSTDAETQAGTDATEAVTPASLQSKVSDSTSTTSSTAIASSTAVKSAYDLAAAALPTSCYTALGALAAGTGAGTAGTLSVGTNGQFLAANSACSTGLQWCTISLACIPCSAFTGAGQLLAGTGTSTFTALGAGSNGQFLTLDNTCAEGMKWVTAQGASLCGFTCSSGNFSVALGFQAGAALTPTGFSNVFVGYNAGCQMSGGDYNVAVGNSSLQGTGSSNVAIGAGAMGQTASTGNNNVAIGYQSADALTSGANNIAIGQGSLGASTTASDQVAVGHQAGCTNTTGAQSVYVGSNAGLLSNSVGSTFIGFGAGCSNTNSGCTTYVGYVSGRNATGLSNTYVGALTGCAASNTSACGTLLGFCAGSALTTGNGNILVGFQAGRNVNSGANNVAIGTAAFQTATTATNNVAVGCGALSGLSTSSGNTALGHRAMLNASTAANNVAVGCNAGEQLSTGSNNVLIGVCAGDTITTGTQNTFIGSASGGLAAGTSEGNTGLGFSALGGGVLAGAYNTAVGNNAGLSLTSGAINTLVGYSAGSAITTGGSNTLVGRYAGTAALANNVVLSDGAGTIRFQSNASGAISLGTGGSYGTAGQILVSGGSGAAPTWSTSASVPANYGSFLRTTTQTNVGGATGQAVIFDTTVASNNFSIVGGTQITAAVAGTYTIVATYQVAKTDTGTDDINVWFKKNGTNVPNSAFNLTLVGNNAAQLATTPWIITLAAGDQIEAWWYSADANAIMLGEPAAAPYPAIPAVNLVIMPVGA
jgi:hypothetical protein